MSFIINESYTRDFIHDELGGEKVSYLPQRGRRIVCGCFSDELNPEVPDVILVGGSNEGEDEGAVPKKARMLIRQGGLIPVFLKKSSNHWTYVGQYRVKGFSEDKRLLLQKQERAGRDNVAIVLFLEPVEETKHAYLLTWNPSRWTWDNLEELARLSWEGKPIVLRWSCGKRKYLPIGSRMFLLRQGVEPKGIIGAGTALSAPYETPHWDDERRERGETSLRVDVQFERLLNPDLDDPLPRSKLRSGRLDNVNWDTQMSGIEIGNALEELEELWQKHVRIFGEIEPSALEGEIEVALCRHRARERWLREVKLAEHRKANGGSLRCEVPDCGFDFYKVYGEIGKDYAQVHHLKPLGHRARMSETKLSDLAVVCANCHAMIHVGGKNRSLENLLKSD